MPDATGIRFFDDPVARTGPHDVPLDFKTGIAAIPGFTTFPIAELHRLKGAIRKVALQDTTDLEVEPTDTLLKADKTVLIQVTSTLLAGAIDLVAWPAPGFAYVKTAALDFCNGVDALIPLPPPAP